MDPRDASKRFFFKRRHGNIDWKKLAAVDLDKVVNQVDVATLTDNVDHITFADLGESDFAQHNVGNNLKLFRMCQLIIEYLLNVQNYLDRYGKEREDAVQEGVEKLREVEEQLREKEAELRQLRREAKFSRKCVKAYERTLTSVGRPTAQTEEAVEHKCGHCNTFFRSEAFLQSHYARRHPNLLPVKQGQAGWSDGTATEMKRWLEDWGNRLQVRVESKLEQVAAATAVTNATNVRAEQDTMNRLADVQQSLLKLSFGDQRQGPFQRERELGALGPVEPEAPPALPAMQASDNNVVASMENMFRQLFSLQSNLQSDQTQVLKGIMDGHASNVLGQLQGMFGALRETKFSSETVTMQLKQLQRESETSTMQLKQIQREISFASQSRPAPMVQAPQPPVQAPQSAQVPLLQTAPLQSPAPASIIPTVGAQMSQSSPLTYQQQDAGGVNGAALRSQQFAEAQFQAKLQSQQNQFVGATSSTQQCSNCEAAVAKVWCADCGTAMCDGCSGLIHKPAKFRGHRPTPISGAAPNSAGLTQHQKEMISRVVQNNPPQHMVVQDAPFVKSRFLHSPNNVQREMYKAMEEVGTVSQESESKYQEKMRLIQEMNYDVRAAESKLDQLVAQHFRPSAQLEAKTRGLYKVLEQQGGPQFQPRGAFDTQQQSLGSSSQTFGAFQRQGSFGAPKQGGFDSQKQTWSQQVSKSPQRQQAPLSQPAGFGGQQPGSETQFLNHSPRAGSGALRSQQQSFGAPQGFNTQSSQPLGNGAFQARGSPSHQPLRGGPSVVVSGPGQNPAFNAATGPSLVTGSMVSAFGSRTPPPSTQAPTAFTTGTVIAKPGSGVSARFAASSSPSHARSSPRSLGTQRGWTASSSGASARPLSYADQQRQSRTQSGMIAAELQQRQAAVRHSPLQGPYAGLNIPPEDFDTLDVETIK